MINRETKYNLLLESFGKEMQELSKNSSLLEKELAQRVGISIHSVRNYKSKRWLPKPHVLQQLNMVFPRLQTVKEALIFKTRGILPFLSPSEQKKIYSLVNIWLAGDGCVCFKSNASDAHYVEFHAAEQEEYLKNKLEVLKPFNTVFSWGIQNGYRRVYIRSRIDPFFTDTQSKWYRNKKKILNKVFFKWLAKQSRSNVFYALSWWYMDDGSYDNYNGHIRLSTENFSKDENLWLTKWFSRY